MNLIKTSPESVWIVKSIANIASNPEAGPEVSSGSSSIYLVVYIYLFLSSH